MTTAGAKSDPAQASPIGRISADRARWRVSVQTWADEVGFRGRFVFERDGARPGAGTREGPPQFVGASREDVLRSAYEVPEQRLRALLHSLG